MSNINIFKPFNPNMLTKPFGLNNNGSLCYLNSIIQSLTSCTIFNEYMVVNRDNFVKKGNKMAISFINIILNNNNENENINILKEIIRLKRKENDKFNFLGQQDCSECISFIIESLDDNNILKMFYHKYQCDILCKNCNKMSNVQDDISYQFEIPMNSNIQVLSKNLRLSISQLPGYKCEGCKNEGNVVKFNRLFYIPPIVVINLNKYFNKQLFHFKKILVFNHEELQQKYIYSLVSIIEHGGNADSGHYVSKSIKKNNDNSYSTYLCNDSHFHNSNLEPSMNSYLLFYHLYKIE